MSSSAASRLLRAVAFPLFVGLLGMTSLIPADGARTSGSSTAPRAFGVAAPGAPGDLSLISGLTSSLGRAPNLVMWYAHWSYRSDFPAAEAARVAAGGAVPEVTWEPWLPEAGVSQPAYALDRITAGDHDAYVTTWARQIKAYKKPVILRFAHEMNGTWYPWAEQVNGNRPGDYVRAWRHVTGVFKAVGATNVTWKWSPNVPYPGSADLRTLYPGDAYVGAVALDGYNWSTLQPGSAWTPFWDVFATGIAQVRALTSKPLYIGEVGCPEVGGDKAAWIRDMFATLAAHPEIRGFTWFDYAKETDWRIASSEASLRAFRDGVLGYR